MKQQKPKQHDINLLSEKQLELFITRIGWVISKISPDYGEDYLVYMFEDGSRTGGTFFIQLKGTDEINQYKLKRSDFFSMSIELRHLKEWQSQAIPVILVLWDVVLERGYWLDVQSFVEEQLDKKANWLSANQETLSVYIPVSQVLDSTNQANFIEKIAAVCDKRKELLQERLPEYRRNFALYADELQRISEHIDLPTSVQQHQDLAMIEAFIAANPNDPRGWEAKATLYYEEIHDMEAALASIKIAVELDPTNKSYIWMKACALAEYALMNDGNPKSMLQEALDIFTSFDGADTATKNYNIGNSLAGLGKHHEAVEHYSLALNANPPDELVAQIWKNKGTSLFHLAQHEEEFACYKKSLELNPNLWQAFTSWATTEIRLGNFSHAEELLLQAVEINPTVVYFGYAQLYWLAYCQWKNCESEEAYQTIQSVLKQKPGHNQARELKAYVLAELWRKDFATYKENAIEYFTTLFLDDPQNPMAQIELFLLYEKLGEIDKARSVLEHTLKLDDIPAQALYHHAMQLRLDGKILEAIDTMGKAFDKSQEHHIVHNMAHLKKAAGEYKDAIHYYQMAKNDCSNPRSILEDMAHCHYFLHEYRECAELMMLLLKDELDNFTWWGNLGFALSELGFSSILLDEFDKIYDAVNVTVDLRQQVDGLLQLEITRFFSTVTKVLSGSSGA